MGKYSSKGREPYEGKISGEVYCERKDACTKDRNPSDCRWMVDQDRSTCKDERIRKNCCKTCGKYCEDWADDCAEKTREGWCRDKKEYMQEMCCLTCKSIQYGDVAWKMSRLSRYPSY